MYKTMKIDHTVELVVQECYTCGTLFGMAGNLERRFRDSKATFYCPNGHPQAYVTSTEERVKQEMKAKIDKLERDYDSQAWMLEHTRSRLAGTRGAMTKLKKRIANGACPCCHRQFVSLARHMKSQHPDYTAPEAGETDN